MRSLLLINPNTTVAMTERMAAAARRFLPADVKLEATTAASGPAVIATRESYEAGAQAVLETYARRRGAFDAVVIACFGDPGLEALREQADEPVLGLAESSIREADGRDAPFAILTMGRPWVEMLCECVAAAKPRSRFVGVFAGEGTGLDVMRNQDQAFDSLELQARNAIDAGARTLILGGGAFAGLADRLKVDANAIDCMMATMRAAIEAMAEPRKPAPPGP